MYMYDHNNRVWQMLWPAIGIHPQVWWKLWMPGTFRATVTTSMLSKMCRDSQAPTLVGGSNAGTCTSIKYEYLIQ